MPTLAESASDTGEQKIAYCDIVSQPMATAAWAQPAYMLSGPDLCSD